jgi:peptidylprolyl isomerase
MSSSKSRRRRPRKKKSNTKKIILAVALLAVAVTIVVVYIMLGNNGTNESDSNQNITSTQMKVLFETSMGNITIQLRDDMPITTGNFKNLVQEGTYDGTIFHRVIADFMIQGGDPTGTGYGDQSIPNIQDEFSDNPENNKNVRGTVAMAKKGDPTTGQAIPDSGSSQFYINVVDNNHLDNTYSVFGEVIEGMDVVDRISEVPTDGDPPNGNNKPLEDVTLIKAQLLD